ncbi:uncharacterized protein LOC107882232 [Acyrthosiphon pisum]|uniref:Uncharacterized protein n=1 Tax=Acyrthosiphon pisum TaxID=7029 RepID=A0A8R2H4R8_ACYPI|nr:uncharacterized protein LOC107882232 [Acyrthosiphon pisum]|eukprot:XP_016655791.1 PREDICTED: uncharacterized protein LOC107882232 [Acyrthosiphon pisum]
MPISPYKRVRKMLVDQGLREQLPSNHPLISLHAKYLELGHEKDSQACKNYLANVSRILQFVSTWLNDRGCPPRHWSELLSSSEEPYVNYFTEREKLGQTTATTINYLKNLHTLMSSAITLYALEYKTFPKSFNGDPSQTVINGIKLLQQKLKILYGKKIKQQSGDLFRRKTAEALDLPEYTDIENVMAKIDLDLPPFLDQLEEHFGPGGMVKVSSEKTSTPAQKHLSGIWRKVVCGLSIHLLWTSKQRSGVVANMLLEEWERRRVEGDKTIVTVSTHKNDDKEPATLVIGHGKAELMERYFSLRQRVVTSAKQFFVTNKGERVTKLYDDINKIYGSRLSASVFRRMVETKSRGHHADVSKSVAVALQHGDL